MDFEEIAEKILNCFIWINGKAICVNDDEGAKRLTVWALGFLGRKHPAVLKFYEEWGKAVQELKLCVGE